MDKKGVGKKSASKTGPIIVVVLAVFLIVVSIGSMISVNERFKEKINQMAQSSTKNTGTGHVSVTVLERPNLKGNVAVVIEPRPTS